ncbi:hypothetical protein P3S67_023899 [Capsicum chacoense]
MVVISVKFLLLVSVLAVASSLQLIHGDQVDENSSDPTLSHHFRFQFPKPILRIPGPPPSPSSLKHHPPSPPHDDQPGFPKPMLRIPGPPPSPSSLKQHPPSPPHDDQPALSLQADDQPGVSPSYDDEPLFDLRIEDNDYVYSDGPSPSPAPSTQDGSDYSDGPFP